MNNRNNLEVDANDLLNDVLNCDIVKDGEILHKSGEVFTQETLELCREKRVVIGPYYKGGMERLSIPAKASSKKFYEVVITPHTIYETYKVWADSKEEAIELVEDGEVDVWDSDASRHSETISVEECTEKELKRIEIEDQREIENAKKEIERLQKKIKIALRGNNGQ